MSEVFSPHFGPLVNDTLSIEFQMSNKVAVPLTKDALLKSYRKRLKDDVTSMLSNFTEIIKLCKIEEPNQISRPAQCEEDAFEMQVRAANMVSIWEQF